MADPPEHPMALAMQWVARIFAAVLMMCLPGVGGQWLDAKWKTGFLGPGGFVLGLVGGMAYLIAVTRQAEAKRRDQRRDGAHSRDDG